MQLKEFSTYLDESSNSLLDSSSKEKTDRIISDLLSKDNSKSEEELDKFKLSFFKKDALNFKDPGKKQTKQNANKTVSAHHKFDVDAYIALRDKQVFNLLNLLPKNKTWSVAVMLIMMILISGFLFKVFYL